MTPPPPLPGKFAGPPHNCRHCGGRLAKEREAKHSGSSCLIILVGLLLTPVLIGIPVILYGLHLGSKCDGWWRCKSCEARFPRKIRWYELG